MAYLQNFLSKDNKNIISTAEIFDIINFANDEKTIHVGIALIKVKAIKAQTEALNRNSESSDKLAIQYNNLTKVIIGLIILQVIAAFLPYFLKIN